MKYNEISILALNVGVLSLFLETFVFLKLLLKKIVFKCLCACYCLLLVF